MATEFPNTPFETDEDTSLFKINSRTETYQDDFAVRLTEAELNAIRVQVIVEVIFNPSSRSVNFAYNPERTVYGRIVHGTNDFLVIRDSLIQYPSQRVYEYRNEAMLTRMYLAFLDRLGVASLQTHASAIVASMVSAGADVEQFNGIIVPLNEETVQRLTAAKLVELQPGGQPLKFIPLGFQPEETYWKFTTDIPGTWFQVTVKRWEWELPAWMPIAQPDPEKEDPDPSPDSESPETPSAPTPGAPPAPGEESPQDPRTRPEDYSSAPPFEEEPPPVRRLVKMVYTVSFDNGDRISGDTGCVFLAPPNPALLTASTSGGLRTAFISADGNPNNRTIVVANESSTVRFTSVQGNVVNC